MAFAHDSDVTALDPALLQRTQSHRPKHRPAALSLVSDTPRESEKLGSILSEVADIPESTIDTLLKRTNPFKKKLGELLLEANIIPAHTLYRALAMQQNLAFANLFDHPPVSKLLSFSDISDYICLQAVPWKERENGNLIIACTEQSEAVEQWANERYAEYKIEFALTAPRDIYYALEHHFQLPIETEARDILAQQTPHLSAKHGLSSTQYWGFFLLATMLVSGLVFIPSFTLMTLFLLLNSLYLSHILFKTTLFLTGLKQRGWRHHSQKALTLSNQVLPIYTILVPLYKEARSIPHLVSSLNALDYPTQKLDIKLILEEDDETTYDAIIKEAPPPHYHIIRVPLQGDLRTKPRACNYALPFARGELLTIYDAEDSPASQQLRLAAQIFHEAPEHVGCLQAKLNFLNRNEHWLACFFSIEYSQLFDIFLPALEALNIPIPLGGTSNHIHLSRLKALGAWDPYNVTEDADLGMRIAAAGLQTRIMPSLTEEEAPITLRSWLNQRSRWIKGHMQTWIVYMRQPRAVLNQVGWRGFLGLQMVIGTPSLVYLTAPFLWLFAPLWASGVIPDGLIPNWMLALNMALLIGGITMHCWQAVLTLRLRRWHRDILTIALYPFYWFLHSAASIKALYQLITRPHYWEKTEHGVSKFL